MRGKFEIIPSIVFRGADITKYLVHESKFVWGTGRNKITFSALFHLQYSKKLSVLIPTSLCQGPHARITDYTHTYKLNTKGAWAQVLICDHSFCIIISMNPGILLVHHLGCVCPKDPFQPAEFTRSPCPGGCRGRLPKALCLFIQGPRTSHILLYLLAQTTAWCLRRPPSKCQVVYTATVDSFVSVIELLLTTLDFFLWLL